MPSAVKTSTPVTREIAPTARTLEHALFVALQWYTSWFYWGAGIWVGLVTGAFAGLRLYLGTLLHDLRTFSFEYRPADIRARLAPAAAPVQAAAAPVEDVQAKAAAAARAIRAKVQSPAAAPLRG